MPGDTPVILIIDGNNLAHHLYPHLTYGRKMTAEDSRRLIGHTISYALDNPALSIELCLDRAPAPPPDGLTAVLPPPPVNLRVLHAEYPQTGDDLLIDRFWFHRISRHLCLVITNDEAILNEVADAGGCSLRVYDFARRVGLENPVLRGIEELPAVIQPIQENDDLPLSLNTSIYFRIVEDPRPGRSPKSKKDSSKQEGRTDAVRVVSQQDWIVPGAENPSEIIPSEDISGQGTAEGRHYLVTVDSWPLLEGGRFLLNSFCMVHRAEYWDLISSIDPQNLSPADLRALAELLLYACGQEPEFTRRGSLMDRVRLALLQARGEPLSLAELSCKTGLKAHGLHGRIKSKAGSWLIFG